MFVIAYSKCILKVRLVIEVAQDKRSSVASNNFRQELYRHPEVCPTALWLEVEHLPNDKENMSAPLLRRYVLLDAV